MDRFKPPSKLREAILGSIRSEERRKARIYITVSSATLLVSVIGFIFSVRYLFQIFQTSEFYTYFSLVFSDPDIVLGYWQDIALSLAESLPILALTMLLIAIWISLASVRIMVRNMRSAFSFSV